MAIAVPATREALATHYTSLAGYIGLHTGNPGTTGANEATGGGYARQPITWATGDASDGVKTATQVAISVPAGTYTHVSLWSAATGGTLRDTHDLPTDVVMSVPGELRVTPTFTQS